MLFGVEMKTCGYCGSDETFEVNTYKHLWDVCGNCGTAYRTLKNKFLFSFIPIRYLRFNEKLAQDVSKIYDNHYNTNQNAEINRKDACEFYEKYIIGEKIEIAGRNVLDISGGGGHFINEFIKYGANVSLTEYNQVSIGYAKKTYGIDVRRFDFNNDSINEVFYDHEKFDVVLLRAAYGFCLNLDKFLKDLKKILNPGAKIIWTSNPLPTLGFFLRWQMADYFQLILRQTDTIIDIHSDNGFTLEKKEEKSIYYTYNNGFIKNLGIIGMSLLYYAPNIYKIPKNTKYNFRDIHGRYSNLIFKNK
jgi:2-polyprenyl-3-methyl-5-hydroxy-6-metoxy-1,4-benzoquinol methylase